MLRAVGDAMLAAPAFLLAQYVLRRREPSPFVLWHGVGKGKRLDRASSYELWQGLEGLELGAQFRPLNAQGLELKNAIENELRRRDLT